MKQMEGMEMDNSIFEATKRVCIAWQNEARQAAYDATHYRKQGLVHLAVREQNHASFCHNEIRMRLERLIGVS
jgi:hypothetical protein